MRSGCTTWSETATASKPAASQARASGRIWAGSAKASEVTNFTAAQHGRAGVPLPSCGRRARMKLTPLLDGLVFGEGPRWRGDRLWLSDMHAHTVLTVDLAGKREDVLHVAGKPSGLGWLPDGRLLVVSMHDRRLLRREADGTLVTHADLSALAGGDCNDMVVDAQGRA